MIALVRSHRRIASTALALGLAGSAATAFALTGVVFRAHAPRPHPLIPAKASATARFGQRLMDQAAAACGAMSYRGVQVVVWRGRSAATRSVLQVWHQRGRGVLVRAASAQSQLQRAGSPADLDDALAGDGTLWISPPLLTIMRARYQLSYAGAGSVDGRPARLVEVRSAAGSVAAKFWLDDATSLPLRREIFAGPDLISTSSFVSLHVGSSSLGTLPGPGGQPWAAQLSRRQLAVLRAGGWPLPRTLGELTLFAASRSGAGSGEVVELSYSDGLSVVSVFIQRGELPAGLSGWHRVTAGGQQVLSVDPDRRGMAWSARGFVYTLIADAPPDTIGRAVAGLPHSGAPGFWARMIRGMRRLLSWADPFR